MLKKITNLLFIFSISGLFPVFMVGKSYSQEGKIIVISKKVGEEISLEEKNKYFLFQSFENFKSATFQLLPDSSYAYYITVIKEGREETIHRSTTLDEIKKIGNYIDNFKIEKVALVGFQTPPFGLEALSTYATTSTYLATYHTEKYFYGQEVAFRAAMVRILGHAILSGILQGIEESSIEDKVRKSIRSFDFGKKLKSVFYRELAAIAPYEVIPMKNVDFLELTKGLQDYNIFKTELGADAVIEGDIKEFKLLYDSQGLNNSFAMVAELKMIYIQTKKVLKTEEIYYYGFTTDYKDVTRKIELDFFYDSDNVIKEFSKAALIMVNDYLIDIKF